MEDITKVLQSALDEINGAGESGANGYKKS